MGKQEQKPKLAGGLTRSWAVAMAGRVPLGGRKTNKTNSKQQIKKSTNKAANKTHA